MTKCLGCGIILQDKDKTADGYTPNISNSLCDRCFKLKNYGVIKKTNKSASDYEKILKSINPSQDLVVFVCDIFNYFQVNLEKLIQNKVLLVLTKRDLLPKSLIDEKLKERIKKDYSSVCDIIIISSFKNYNLDLLFNKIKEYQTSKIVHFIGYTNAGKSTLLNKIIKNYSNQEEIVTTSYMPSTTLDQIPIKIDDYLTIIDNPGLIEEGNIINYLDPKDIKRITPTKEIKPRTYQLKGIGTLLIDKFARISYECERSNIVIYLANNLEVSKINEKNERLKEFEERIIELNKNEDLIIKGLCFIKTKQKITFKIKMNSKVDIIVRENFL